MPAVGRLWPSDDDDYNDGTGDCDAVDDDNDDEESRGKCAGINKGDERRDREAAAPFISKQLPSSPCLLLLCRIHTILLDLPLLVAVKWNTKSSIQLCQCVCDNVSKMSSCEAL